MTKRWIRTFDEEDAYTGWRKAYHWRPGVLHAIKRRTHKRERREGRAEARAEARDRDE
jgi:hypothetical protein